MQSTQILSFEELCLCELAWLRNDKLKRASCKIRDLSFTPSFSLGFGALTFCEPFQRFINSGTTNRRMAKSLTQTVETVAEIKLFLDPKLKLGENERLQFQTVAIRNSPLRERYH